MVLLEYHGLWRSWELVYTHLAVIGELNVGLRAPGSEPEEMAGLGGTGVAEPWVQKVASRLRHTRAPWVMRGRSRVLWVGWVRSTVAGGASPQP